MTKRILKESREVRYKVKREREAVVLFRASGDEVKRLQGAADARGLSLSAFVRSCALVAAGGAL